VWIGDDRGLITAAQRRVRRPLSFSYDKVRNFETRQPLSLIVLRMDLSHDYTGALHACVMDWVYICR